MNVEELHTQETGRNSPQQECGAPGAGRWGAGLERQLSQAPWGLVGPQKTLGFIL